MSLNFSKQTKQGVFALAMSAFVFAQAPLTVNAANFKYTTQLPQKNFQVQNILEFSKCVAEKSDITIDVYDSAQLYRDKEVPSAVASGAVELGMSTTERWAGTIPAMGIFSVPFALGGRDTVLKLLKPGAEFRKVLDEALVKTGVRPIYWMEYGTVVFLSKKDRPIRMPEDLKGMKVRTFGKTLGDFVNSVGGAATIMSGSEQFVAYQRGTVDAGMTGVASFKSRKLDEVMNVITFTQHGHIYFPSVINEKVWQGLSADQKSALKSCGDEAQTALHNEVGSAEAEAIAYAKDKGADVIELSAEDLEKWREAGQPTVKEFVNHSGELGQKLLELVEKAK